MNAGTDMRTVRVELGQRGYDIVIGAGVLGRAGEFINPLLASPRVLTVTDENVAEHWLEPYRASLAAAGIKSLELVLPAGERTKSFEYLERVVRWLLDAGVQRRSMVVALGGGVIGDLTGFAAAVTLRGLPLVQIPTTLLAQVDSSVGGKTAIDTPEGKNLVGAFHQPSLVLADTKALDTLPHRQVMAGYAEVVKYGLLGDHDFFEWCERNGEAVAAGDAAARAYAIQESCEAKAEIVAEDELEAGQRALLNLGHTFGHAFEAEAGFDDKLLHGEAVAIGMVSAFEFSARIGLCTGQDVTRVKTHFTRVGLPTGLAGIKQANWTAERILHHMGRDKKAEAGGLTFILTKGIGEAFVQRKVDEAELARYLEDLLGA
ncbi:MAG: 3-dehydroquinate synthase [Rhodospirillaceae bacterium]